jgi:5-methylcytosine-specific restriction enzyme A
MLGWRANNRAHIRAYANARYRQKSKHVYRLQKARKKRRSNARKRVEREYQRQWMANWRAANPELARAKKRRLMYLNRERYLAVRRATAATPENKLKAAARFRRWAQSNLGKTYFKESFHRRRARKRFVETANCLERIRELRNAKICYWCGSAMERVTVDHVIPIACGGSHTPENLVACCIKCNSSKRSLLPSEWAGRQQPKN